MAELYAILAGIALIMGFYNLLIYTGIKKYFTKTLDSTLVSVAAELEDIFKNPTVKSAMTIIGKKGNESQADEAIIDDLATDMLGSPQFSGINLVADMIGIDLDSYIDKHGALGTMQGLTQIAGMLGIDVNQLLSGGLSNLAGPAVSGVSNNPYLNGGN